MSGRIRILALCAVSALAVPLLGTGTASAHPGSSGPVVVVSGLNNPRQLSLVGNVQLLIAEAGKGGSTQIGSGEDATFVGSSGSISSVFYPQYRHNTKPVRIIKGLLSAAGADGSAAVGSDGVSGTWVGGPIFIQETFAPPELPSAVPGAQSGKLLVGAAYHTGVYPVADISGYEAAKDWDGHGVDSNPYAALVVRDGVLVADAAANDVIKVDRHGHRSLFHVFANITGGSCAGQEDPPGFPGCNFVPTSLASDRWGHIFVGGLGSEAPGAGRVVELDSSGRHVLHTWTGFTSVTGVAVARDGSVYVSQLEAAEQHPVNPMAVGVVTKINCNGHRTNVDVPFPAGIAVDNHGYVYVAAFSIAPAGGLGVPGLDTSGQVWRLRI